ncbi:MAG: YdeI/OmpD-associated family protein [Saprospiraceae bacterium]|nr:YdeI/OmpD-associated family protein [Saprospiraceae bacterium]MBK7524783.1 YdeI/OmpD-associated family protein [Saprospiraceae bacterium]MBK8081478.1 YdeI/OmpD-associated family protein [Saprospiraceae bacterium]MBK8549441.1 YdeI/OmpD-associated family protein [Saprospiraceae bacterium]MBK8855162.1 YdeI/OmpD-associated family protein [Saprospiraceae bacterium]
MAVSPLFFKDKTEFRQWLEKNHDKEKELSVGFYKAGSGQQNMTWSESVDQALCFGWIDGVRHSIDDISYKIRFTPRKAASIWSKVNLEKMKELIDKNLVQEAGLKIYRERKMDNTNVYSFENEKNDFDEELKNRFLSFDDAWKFFNALAPSYQKNSIHWIQSAKQETTRLKRLQIIIDACSNHINIWKNPDLSRKK